MKNIFTIFVALIISLIMVEIFLKLFLPFPLSGSWRVQDQNGLLLNKKNIKTKHEYIANGKIIRANYTFGEFNNRVYKKLYYKKNKPKVLVLGDSFTFGWLLNDQDTFIYQLADHYKNFEFINVAAGGWGTSDYLSYIENYCKTIKPDIILLFLNHSDHERAVNSNLYLLNDKMKLEKGKNKISKSKKMVDSLFFYEFMIENSHLFQLLRSLSNLKFINKQLSIRHTKSTQIKNVSNNISKNIIQIKKIYQKIDSQIDKCGSNYLFIDLGWPFDVSNNYFKKVNKETLNFLYNNNFNIISLKDKMKKINRNLKDYEIPLDKHPNSAANHYIFQILKEEKLF